MRLTRAISAVSPSPHHPADTGGVPVREVVLVIPELSFLFKSKLWRNAVRSASGGIGNSTVVSYHSDSVNAGYTVILIGRESWRRNTQDDRGAESSYEKLESMHDDCKI